jgi:CBS domain containing-hemolysin-like protein
LIGEVSDEHDRAKADVVKTGDTVTFPASLRPDELRERAGIDVPDDGPWETVGGFLLSEWGYIPEAGAILDACGGQFVVERMDGRRIDRVRFAVTEETDE